MISVGLTSISDAKKSCKACSAKALLTGWLLREATAVTRVKAPSSSRIFSVKRSAIRSKTSLGTLDPFIEAIIRKIAIRVSKSGGLISTVKPDSNLEISLDSNPLRFLGATSEAITILLLA